MSRNFVIGLDIGGTSVRALIVDHEGSRVGVGLAGGANPTSHDPSKAAVELRSALSAALADVPASRVVAGVIGLAGVGKLTADARARAAFESAWRDAGLRCPYRLTSDALVAYASGSSVADGTVLVAGTGAIAAAVRGWQLTRVADGHGWLLGDLGSGHWLGREAVRAALAVCDGAAPDGLLARSVRAALDISAMSGATARATASALVQAVNSRPAVALAELAPLVLAAATDPASAPPDAAGATDPATARSDTAAATDPATAPPDAAGATGPDPAARSDAAGATGPDPVARSIVAAAAGHLVATVALVHVDGHPLVLGGGLLTTENALAADVRARVTERWPSTVPHRAGEGAAAAAWLAAHDAAGFDAIRLRAALFGAP